MSSPFDLVRLPPCGNEVYKFMARVITHALTSMKRSPRYEQLFGAVGPEEISAGVNVSDTRSSAAPTGRALRTGPISVRAVRIQRVVAGCLWVSLFAAQL